MTIIASVKVRDGVVLATDSMSQVNIRDESGRIVIIKSYCSARKLFRVRDFSIGIMTFGLGNIGTRSIESLILEFSRGLEQNTDKPLTVENVSKGLFKFIKGIYEDVFKNVSIEQRKKDLRIGFLVCGYSPGEFLASEWEFELPLSEDIHQVRRNDQFGAS